jgi:hypothetical protein
MTPIPVSVLLPSVGIPQLVNAIVGQRQSSPIPAQDISVLYAIYLSGQMASATQQPVFAYPRSCIFHTPLFSVSAFKPIALYLSLQEEYIAARLVTPLSLH